VGWAVWAGEGWVGRQGKAGGVGRPAGPSGMNSEEEFFSNKNWILNLPRLGNFVEGDLGGILKRVFFLNSSRLLKDFRKI
jgi:hypothetical protein